MARKKKLWMAATVTEPLNLRTKPSLEAQKLCIMGAGEKIEVATCDAPFWYAVKFMDLQGYAMAHWIELAKLTE